MKKPVRLILIAALFTCAPAYAKGWFSAACERLLGGSSRTLKYPPRLDQIRDMFATQVHFINRFTSHPMQTEIGRLENVADEPVSVVVKPRLGSEYQWISRKPTIEAIVNPMALHLKWEDTERELNTQPAFVILLDDVEVHDHAGPRRLTDLIQEEIGYVRHRNPDLNFELRIKPACEFKQLTFKSDGCVKSVVWVEGDLSNFQVKRVTMAALEHAFEVLVRDLAYCRKTGAGDQ